MKILVLLGEGDEYLGYQKFQTEDDLDQFLLSIQDLMMANVEKKLTLRERLKMCPEYFPYAGRVVDFDVID